jgi:hypothetical protein
MPDRDDRIRLVQLLLRATERGTITWEGTADEYAFETRLPRGLVRLSQSLYGSPPFQIELQDQHARTLRAYPYDDTETAHLAGDLFAKARNAVLKVDQTVSGLFKDLEARAAGEVPTP